MATVCKLLKAPAEINRGLFQSLHPDGNGLVIKMKVFRICLLQSGFVQLIEPINLFSNHEPCTPK